jgi:hypothetical protein
VASQPVNDASILHDPVAAKTKSKNSLMAAVCELHMRDEGPAHKPGYPKPVDAVVDAQQDATENNNAND